jgi:hypothetical protein
LLTDKHKNLVISANFLRKYEGKSDIASRRKPLKEKYIVTNDTAKLKQNRSSNLRFSNSSLIFWNGVSLSCYRKTTYKEEDDELLKNSYGYDFGNWKSYPTPELSEESDAHKEFATLFNSGRRQIVVSRTCSDMIFTPTLAKSVKLLILTANDSPHPRLWRNKVCNVGVCICDANKGGGFFKGNFERTAKEIFVAPFICDELLSTLISYYGDHIDETADIDCCSC